MTPVVARLVDRWRADPKADLYLRPGATAEQLDAFERRYGNALPAALRDLYMLMDGNQDGNWPDDNMICLHPLAEVVPLRVYPDAWPSSTVPEIPGWVDRWFVLADYLIDSHLFLIRLDVDSRNPGPVVIWYGDSERHRVAPSFVAFLEGWETQSHGFFLAASDLLPGDAL